MIADSAAEWLYCRSAVLPARFYIIFAACCIFCAAGFFCESLLVFDTEERGLFKPGDIRTLHHIRLCLEDNLRNCFRAETG